MDSEYNVSLIFYGCANNIELYIPKRVYLIVLSILSSYKILFKA